MSRFLFIILCVGILFMVSVNKSSAISSASTGLIVVSDGGVDDLVALEILNRYTNIDLIVSTGGNVSVEQAYLNIKKAIGSNSTIIKGSSSPLHFTRSQVGVIIHGRDGFFEEGGIGDASSIPENAIPEILRIISEHEQTTILSLAPMTDIAKAVEFDPLAFKHVSIVAVGGAKHSGNQTPVSEYNVWQDPHAVQIVANSSATKHFIPIETFIVPWDAKLLEHLELPEFMSTPVAKYLTLQTTFAGEASLPDLIGVFYVLQTVQNINFGFDTNEGLLWISTHDDYTRGQTIFGLSGKDQLLMRLTSDGFEQLANQYIQDPNFDLASALYGVFAQPLPSDVNNVIIVTVDNKQFQKSIKKL